MEDNEKKVEKARARTTAEQLETYLSFLETNPDFLASKNTPRNPNHLDEKWKELSIKLNALQGPTKTSKEWKTSLGHWKNQLKSRARKNKVEQLLTGGGSPCSSFISSFEERALNIFGQITLTGEEEVPALGFEDTIDLRTSPNVSTTDEPNASTADEINSLNKTSTDCFGIEDQPAKLLTQKSTSRKRGANTVMDVTEKILKLANDRVEQDKLLAQERLAIDQKNADAMLKIGEAMQVMAKAFAAQSNN